LLTNGALRQRTAGEFLVPLSIVLLEVTVGLVRWHSQQLTAQGQLSPAATIGKEAVVADPLKPLGENVHQEAANKLVGGEGHGFALAVVAAAVICGQCGTRFECNAIYDALKRRGQESKEVDQKRYHRKRSDGADKMHVVVL
jgi:hypothetical protein